MPADDLQQVRIWKGTRFERGHEYFDLNNPERGVFVATGEESAPSDQTYTCRDDVPEQIWARLVTWRQPISASQAGAIQATAHDLGIGRERSTTWDARPLPPE